MSAITSGKIILPLLKKVGALIEAAVANLSRFPEFDRIGEVTGTRELIVPGFTYIIIYRLRGDAVHILRIFHSKQKWPQPF